MGVIGLDKLYRLLALEFNCAPEDFRRAENENVLTVSELLEGRRVYSPEKYFFHMVTTGSNAVITSDECLHPFLREFMRERTGHWLFELPNLLPLEKELNSWGYSLTQTYHMFLPEERVPEADMSVGATCFVKEPDFRVEWFYEEQIRPFYGDERFSNAICAEYTPSRPDRMVVCAYDGDRMMGMTGCSEDAPDWMQIGIDVLPEYRSRGVGTYLVTLLKKKILEQGKIPFYGTSLSNYHSWNIALNSGFRPAWVEIGAKKAEIK